MLWVIRELKQRPVLYGFSFFIILSAYLAGGMAALRLEETLRGATTMFFFSGNEYRLIVGSVVGKRLVLMGVQAFFCIWMAGMPFSVFCGMFVQISLSLPWWCMVQGTSGGMFISVLTLLPGMMYLLAGTYTMKISLAHFVKMVKERRVSKSAVEKLQEGIHPVLRMLAADGIMLVCVPIEVFFFMNIAG